MFTAGSRTMKDAEMVQYNAVDEVAARLAPA